ncbi:MAG TPA: HlyD family type I secretion periplasmic adaptor subunit [Deltaproteobacteria bacterium]|nr:HlyD family type I secretion periplasmic adaptor subunit [Deltaproteobacteria bacterium]HQB38845.1 HlyD family type I secretion periplasmic adaptor subunit [Deltaproteobacteria bacterium]
MSMKHRIEAFTELIGRYRAVFNHYWQIRKQLDGKMLAADEAEFLPAALSLQERPVSPVTRLLAKVLMTLVLVLLAWSIFGKVDIIVNASGKVIPSGYSKTIACVDVASVRALHVQEGQQVKAGDLLIELDTSMSDAERDKAAGDHDMSLLQIAGAKALVAAIDSGTAPRMPAVPGVPADKWQSAKAHLDAQYRDFTSKLKRIDGDIARYSEALPLAAQRAADYKELLKTRDVSHHAWLEKEQARVDLAGQLTDAKNQRRALIEETRRIAYDKSTDGIRMASASRQDAMRADAHSRLLRLTSPVDGTVQQLDVHTIGGVVAAAKPLMQIVPRSSKVEVEAFMENKDVGFVQVGQDAEVKIDAFLYTKYGTVKGKVTHVSHDAIADEKRGLIYSTRIMLDRSTMNIDGKEMPLSPGMSANVEIKTGDRRIIEYVLSPLMRHKRESLNER